ncbi:P-loop containing nucleoside triphosphate hydrolase protein [Gongronella butleri]|nr:P-loop containing nucleoside triphosphate hydrolase protein [Gongronella butleri]
MPTKNNNDTSHDIWHQHHLNGHLPPEVDHEGNIEYKLKLVDPSAERMEHLITQMKWRLAEGRGEALYELGVSDDGTLTGLSAIDMEATLATVRRMAQELNAEVSIRRDMAVGDQRVIEARIRQRGYDNSSNGRMHHTDLRVVVIGDTGTGKSTLIGHLSHGIKDTGHGTARISLLRHPHEMETGHTSSIVHEMLGYTLDGQLVNMASDQVDAWEHICAASAKVMTLLDTCGHKRYLRTTISAMMGYAPDYAMLVVPATLGSQAMSTMANEHGSLALMLDVPLMVVVTKIDIASNDQINKCLLALDDHLTWLQDRLGHDAPRFPRVVQNVAAARTTARSMMQSQTIPILLVSNVTGKNMDHVHAFLHALDKPTRTMNRDLLEDPVEFHVEQVYQLEDTGTVIGGVLRRGHLQLQPLNDEKTNDHSYALGPNSQGDFIRVKIVSIHRHRMNMHDVHCGQTASLALQLPSNVANNVTNSASSAQPSRPSSSTSTASSVSSSSSVSVVDSWGKIKKGMVLLAIPPVNVNDDGKKVPRAPRNAVYSPPPPTTLAFEAQLLLLPPTAPDARHAADKNTSPVPTPVMRAGLCGMLRSGFIRQQARIVQLNVAADEERPQPPQGDTAMVPTAYTAQIRLLGNPEFLAVGNQFIFMESALKCLGRITKLVEQVNGKWVQ